MGFLDTVKSAKAKVQAAAKAVKATDASDAIPTAPSATDDYAPLKSSNDTILALDIGTEFVKAVIARQTKDHGLDIIGVGKARTVAAGNLPPMVQVSV